mgnify:FL=1|jgi:hypothetical protein
MKKTVEITVSVQQEINMENVSPVLPENIKNYLIDIDGTVTDDVPNEEPWRMLDCEPYDGSVNIINSWYQEGHTITFFTSRTEEHRAVTEIWLQKNGFQYHHLLMNKPRGGNYHWIDNHIVRATRYNGVWSPLTTKKVDIQVFEQ